MKLKQDHYTYRVTWSPEDEEHVGLCLEFPSLSWLAKTPEKALSGIREIVGSCLEDMKKSNEAIPEPLAQKHYSGKFMVRVTPSLHRLLAIQASESGISLNRYINTKLSN